MEFSYRISEAQYLQARKLGFERGSKPAKVKTILFWLFIFICLMLLWTIVQKSATQRRSDIPVPAAPVNGAQTTENPAPSNGVVPEPSGPAGHDVHTKPANTAYALLLNVLPFVAILLVWGLLLARLGPNALRRIYRKDPQMQGEFTVNIAPSAISIRNTAETSSQSGWNIYEYWREGKDLIILKCLSGGLE
jgi:cytochrome c-type biogenesis protein CcmH/NrfF